MSEIAEPQHPRISSEERRAASTLMSVLKILLEMNPRMTTPHARTFLRVVAEPGLTVSELARSIGVPSNTISKHLQELGTEGRGHRLGLLTTEGHLGDLRERRVVLTARGLAVARTMIAVYRRNYGKRSGRPKVPSENPSPTAGPEE